MLGFMDLRWPRVFRRSSIGLVYGVFIPLQISLISVKISRADECLPHSLNGRLERWSFDIDSRFQFIDFLSFVAMTLHAIRIEGPACLATSDKQVQFSSTFGDLDDDLYGAVHQLE